jgi:hypothetical protein
MDDVYVDDAMMLLSWRILNDDERRDPKQYL